ncbi:MAG: DUF2059 domain-containing protein [Wenzhouxiangella sp.]
MLKVILLFATATLLAAPAAADSKHERIIELMELMQLESQFEQIQVQMRAMIDNMAPDQEVPAGEQEIIDRYNRKMLDLSQETLGWRPLQAMMIDLYAAYFTEQEIIDMIEFYRTPTGQRTIELMPMIMEESMLFTHEAMATLMPRMQALSEAMNAELAEYRRQADAAD